LDRLSAEARTPFKYRIGSEKASFYHFTSVLITVAIAEEFAYLNISLAFYLRVQSYGFLPHPPVEERQKFLNFAGVKGMI